jgi:hypothetical protein
MYFCYVTLPLPRSDDEISVNCYLDTVILLNKYNCEYLYGHETKSSNSVGGVKKCGGSTHFRWNLIWSNMQMMVNCWVNGGNNLQRMKILEPVKNARKFKFDIHFQTKHCNHWGNGEMIPSLYRRSSIERDSCLYLLYNLQHSVGSWTINSKPK